MIALLWNICRGRRGPGIFSSLVVFGLISGFMASCTHAAVPSAPQATPFFTGTPGVTMVPYTQDVPVIETAIAGMAEQTETQAGGGNPISSGRLGYSGPSRSVSHSCADRIRNRGSKFPPLPLPTSSPRLMPKYWREWPVVPTISAKAWQVYQKGLELGNNPHACAHGDCREAFRKSFGPVRR